MKIFTNLPAILRVFFNILRILTIILGVFWILVLTNSWLIWSFAGEPKLIVTVGEISLPTAANTIGLSSDTAGPGSLALHSLRGTLQVDISSHDSALVSALRLTIIPSMAEIIVFSFILFTSLRNLCASLAVGDVFNEGNLLLVRRIGVTLIVYSLVCVALAIFGSAVMGNYFQAHVQLTGLATTLPFSNGPLALQFSLPEGLLTNPGGFVTGCLVLVVGEAFRQGLKLKTENDLTV
jgi:hypothetical protein